MADVEWETSKENVAPLRGGRNVQVLNKALKTPIHQLEAERSTREEQVRAAMAGHGPHKDDPLEAWSRYTKWIVETYAAGSEVLIRTVEEACRMYAKNERYRDDIRLVRLWIRYVDLRTDKLDAFNYMNRKGIGESWSLFYEAWAITLEIARQYDEAERVYRIGRERQAKPVERLALREREYCSRMAARRRRDEKKKIEAEKRILSETRREEARKLRESSRATSSLANSVLSGTDADQKSAYEAPVHRVRPALGKISESQAKSGRRPFVLQRKQRRSESIGQAVSQTHREGTRENPQKFDVFMDEDTSVSPVIYGMEHSLKKTEEDGHRLPELAKKDDLRKEDEGRLPSKWVGETLPQENSLKSKLNRGSGLPFEVYQDPAGVSSPSGPIVEAAIKDVRQMRTETADTFDDLLDRRCVPQRTSTGPKPSSWLRESAVGSGSPTINTKLAMKEVDDIFNSTHPMDREPESHALRTPGAQPIRERTLDGHRSEIIDYMNDGKAQRNLVEKHSYQGKERFAEENVRPENQVVPRLPGFESTSVDPTRAGGVQSDTRKLYESGPLKESQQPIPELNSSRKLQRSNEYDITGFLASWCNNDSHFQLLEDPDPEVDADGMFDLQCRQGLVSFNVDKFRWTGYCDHSYVVLADDLNNTFGLMRMSEEAGSDDDDFKVVAIKVSLSSNAWEYYIYKTIHSRLGSHSESIPQALSFCEGNRKSLLILNSYSSCSVRETQILLGEKFPESLSMFFTVSILRVLEDLHGIGIIHSDVTLDNILFRSDLKMDISKHPYSASGESGWSRWGVLLVDYNHAVDARHPQVSGLDMMLLARHIAKQGNSFLDEEFRNPNANVWAYNGDCYSASTCAARMLGFSRSNFRNHVSELQYASTWESFFLTMEELGVSSTARETCQAMRSCRVRMEAILSTDHLLAFSLMQLVNRIVDAENEDMTSGF